MTKELESGRKNSRVFSMSKQLRTKSVTKTRKKFTIIEIGRIEHCPVGGVRMVPFRTIDGISEIEMERASPEIILETLCNWFDEQSVLHFTPKQKQLF